MPAIANSARPQANRDGRRLTTADRAGTPIDWAKWHADYETDSPLRRRLAIVQRHIVTLLNAFEASPLRVVSMCAGEARDLLGALSAVSRRDVTGRLVELNPELASHARRGCDELGLEAVEVVVGDAGHTRAYDGAVPADLVLACGVFGNISDADVERTVRAFPMFCASDARLIWTRHRREPDLTPRIRAWLHEAEFDEVAFEPVPDSPGSVGVARYMGELRALTDQPMFEFTRETF